MKPRKQIPVTLLLGLAPILALLFAMQTARATAPEMDWGEVHVGVVVDTTETMQPEINALAMALDTYETRWLTETFHLVGFKDQPLYRGNTTDLQEFIDWFDSIVAGGGGNCPDQALGGLNELAANVPSSKSPPADVLLATDATPFGNRQHYAFLADRLLRRGVRVHTLLSGWCAGAPLAENALAYLSLATGGQSYYPVTASDYVTDAVIALGVMAYRDTILVQKGSVTPNEPDLLSFPVDSTITILGVEEEELSWECPPFCCYTCTLPLAAGNNMVLDLGGAVEVELIDPDGNVLVPGTSGYQLLESTSRSWHVLDNYSPPLEGGPIFPGGWELRVSGTGAYEILIVSDSMLHMAYLGSHTLTRGRPVPLRAVLIEEAHGESNPVVSADFRLVALNGQQTIPIDLFDDGNHGDGEAGDGLYGGVVNPAVPGLWRLAVQGELSDGTTFRRIDPAPLRVVHHRLPTPPARLSLPDNTVLNTFTLFNEDPAAEGGSTTFDLALFSSLGWTPTGTIPLSITLNPGESVVFSVETTVPAGAVAGEMEEVTLTAVPTGNIGSGLSATGQISVVDRLPTFLPVALKP